MKKILLTFLIALSISPLFGQDAIVYEYMSIRTWEHKVAAKITKPDGTFFEKEFEGFKKGDLSKLFNYINLQEEKGFELYSITNAGATGIFEMYWILRKPKES